MGDKLDAVYIPANEISSVQVCADEIKVQTADGRTMTVPLVWFPFLLNASKEERQRFRVVGHVIDWEALDDGISMETFLMGLPTHE
ncbi:MAG TPA: DUF2442 domain-containing protein [Phototrophicaceae bacterium]|nr:DUF2442 domain-containing protein [Phototrophicaceae bacterium]